MDESQYERRHGGYRATTQDPASGADPYRSFHSPANERARAIVMPSRNPLKQLRHLDRSSPDFHDQLSDILHGEEYKKWVPNIQGGDLAGIVNYLDKVRCHI